MILACEKWEGWRPHQHAQFCFTSVTFVTAFERADSQKSPQTRVAALVKPLAPHKHQKPLTNAAHPSLGVGRGNMRKYHTPRYILNVCVCVFVSGKCLYSWHYACSTHNNETNGGNGVMREHESSMNTMTRTRRSSLAATLCGRGSTQQHPSYHVCSCTPTISQVPAHSDPCPHQFNTLHTRAVQGVACMPGLNWATPSPAGCSECTINN